MAADDHRCPDCQSLMPQPWRINAGNGLEIVCSGCGARKLDAAALATQEQTNEMLRASGLFQAGPSAWSNDPATVYKPDVEPTPAQAAAARKTKRKTELPVEEGVSIAYLTRKGGEATTLRKALQAAGLGRCSAYSVTAVQGQGARFEQIVVLFNLDEFEQVVLDTQWKQLFQPGSSMAFGAGSLADVLATIGAGTAEKIAAAHQATEGK